MRSVKRVLLGSAAGMIAVAGAQAADLPVKAAPVEYVKVCSLYGAGFWYIPGTDTCIKLGSYVRAEYLYNVSDGETPIGQSATAGTRFTRTDTAQFGMRYRAQMSFDLRTQTEYGTLRTYMSMGNQWTSASNAAGSAAGLNTSSNNNNVDVERAFIQFAGMTAGRMRSFFDIASPGPYGLGAARYTADSSPTGVFGIGYTWQLGNGISANVMLQDPGWISPYPHGGRTTVNLALDGFGGTQIGNNQTTFDNAGAKFMDPVFNLRMDQSWGYVGVSGVLHDASGGYYGGAGGIAGTCVGSGQAGVSLDTCGHPADTWGWAAAFGFTLTNMFGFVGDTLAFEANYGKGANGYVLRNNGSYWGRSNSNNVGTGQNVEAVYANGTNVELTEAFATFVGYDHIWSPRWHSTATTGYTFINYDDTAKKLICTPGLAGSLGTNIGTAGGGLAAGTVTGNCNPNFSTWGVTTATFWNPHPDLTLGLELVYYHLNTANNGGTAFIGASGALPAGTYTFSNQNIMGANFRINRNFLY